MLRAMLAMRTATLSNRLRPGRPDMLSISPQGPVALSTSLPSARTTITVAPTSKRGPNIDSSSLGITTHSTKAGSERRRIQLVAAT